MGQLLELSRGARAYMWFDETTLGVFDFSKFEDLASSEELALPELAALIGHAYQFFPRTLTQDLRPLVTPLLYLLVRALGRHRSAD